MDGRHQHLHVPELRLFAAPAVDNSPWRIADDATSRHAIDAVQRVFWTPNSAASIFRVASWHKKDIVHPCPDHAPLNILAGLHFVPHVDQGGDVVVAVSGVDPDLARISPEMPLEDSEAFVPNDGHGDV